MTMDIKNDVQGGARDRCERHGGREAGTGHPAKAVAHCSHQGTTCIRHCDLAQPNRPDQDEYDHDASPPHGITLIVTVEPRDVRHRIRPHMHATSAMTT